jgi:Domain of unknown function (DUF3291)
MLASVTRLRVRAFAYLPAFLWMTFRSRRQVSWAAGFSGGRLLIDSHRTYWTLTVWESEHAMKQFRGSGAHGEVMPKLAKWCDEASYAHWTIAEATIGDGTVPSWPEAYAHLVTEGRLSRVEHPSADHEARRFPQPRLKPLIGQNLKPAARPRK